MMGWTMDDEGKERAKRRAARLDMLARQRSSRSDGAAASGMTWGRNGMTVGASLSHEALSREVTSPGVSPGILAPQTLPPRSIGSHATLRGPVDDTQTRAPPPRRSLPPPSPPSPSPLPAPSPSLPRRIGRGAARLLEVLVLVVVIGGVGFLAGGFLRYLDRVEGFVPAPVASVPLADGIVVLTGGPDRLASAGDLLEAGRAPRLLVSGVNEATTPSDVATLLGINDALLDCCVTLGFEALDTRGNAREAAGWLVANPLSDTSAPDTAPSDASPSDTVSDPEPHLIVVTSNYHMQRALYELRHAVPGVELVPYAVTGIDLEREGWWREASNWRVLTSEYAKTLLAMSRRIGWLDGALTHLLGPSAPGSGVAPGSAVSPRPDVVVRDETNAESRA